MQAIKNIEDSDLNENDIVKSFCNKCGKNTLFRIIVVNENITGICSKCRGYKTLKKNENYIQEISTKNIPKCPICQSTNIKKITITKRAVKMAIFGAIGAIDDAGKTYQCNNCGSKF